MEFFLVRSDKIYGKASAKTGGKQYFFFLSKYFKI